MHIEIKETNPLYATFDACRIREGYTSFKSAVIAAMILFVEHNDNHDNVKENTNDNISQHPNSVTGQTGVDTR